ncbi:Mrs2 protein [Saccharomycopsis crataegensis]|uniref:Magnesium transporter n=1 Tax=Saccharomycopsis crataegensis TaxID=43959 RepID=A0AAV5QTB2_9ASCO|nr:Mrs2 protein [Saccharomycopsis crataegensis]
MRNSYSRLDIRSAQSSSFSSYLPNNDSQSNSRISLRRTNSSYSLTLKPVHINDNYVSCTTINVHGDIECMSKKYPKMDFLRKLDLYPRDLRKIDNSSIDIVPTVAVRKNCILVNLLHIKSIIMKDKIMIFDTSDSSSVSKLSLFIYDLQDKLKTNITQNTSFEFKALETILINVMSVLENDLNYHISKCTTVLTELENQIDRTKLRDLLIYSKALTNYSQKSLLIRNVLDELLETDEDLKGMYLTQIFNVQSSASDQVKSLEEITKKSQVSPSQISLVHNNTKDSSSMDSVMDSDGGNDFNFSEVEILLENYYTQCDEFVQQANSLISDIKSTEEIVNIILDSNRNSLMLYDLKITIYTLGFTVATTVPAFYGMNLKNFIEDSPYGFGMVVGISIFSALGITMVNFNKLRSVQRLTMMMGNDGNLDRFIKENMSIGTSSESSELSYSSKAPTNSSHPYITNPSNGPAVNKIIPKPSSSAYTNIIPGILQYQNNFMNRTAKSSNISSTSSTYHTNTIPSNSGSSEKSTQISLTKGSLRSRFSNWFYCYRFWSWKMQLEQLKRFEWALMKHRFFRKRLGKQHPMVDAKQKAMAWRWLIEEQQKK